MESSAGNARRDEYRREEQVLAPATDIFETTEGYGLRLEMPGVEKEQLSVTIDNNELVVEGKVNDESPQGKSLRYSEYTLYNFYRKFIIGNDIDRARIDAVLENGVLNLNLHKHEAAKPKRIEVKVV
ncbi:MAG: Hsp20/alpha crystallin family protein [Spirochaetes bacterium]|nr:Hsp20/alpha crystallin family protein [Spirochaetota bacterium]